MEAATAKNLAPAIEQTKLKKTAADGTVNPAYAKTIEADFSTNFVNSGLADQILQGLRQLPGVTLPKVEHMHLPHFIKEVADHFSAARLKTLWVRSQYLQRNGLDVAGVSIYEFKKFGDHVSMPVLNKLDLGFDSFQKFGRKNDFRCATQVKLKNATAFEEFPRDIKLDSLTVLNMENATAFKGFPRNFFDRSPNVKSLQIAGTGIAYADLPDRITRDKTIYVDQRPEAELDQHLNARQSNHNKTVIYSSSVSAQKVIARFPDLNERHEIDDLKRYILNLAPHNDHIEAAQRAASQDAMLPTDYHEPHFGINMVTDMAAKWRATKTPSLREAFVSEETAQAAFVKILYLSKREYNLHDPKPGEAGLSGDLVDDGKPDGGCCEGGVFNFATNCTVGLLKDSHISFISADTIDKKVGAEIKAFIKDNMESAGNRLATSDLDEDGAEDGAKHGVDDPLEAKSVFTKRLTNEAKYRMTHDLLPKLYEYFEIPGEPKADFSKRKVQIKGYFDEHLKVVDVTALEPKPVLSQDDKLAIDFFRMSIGSSR